jgi:two-component system cell cycle sensor histidine kinase/response regulator CckA
MARRLWVVLCVMVGLHIALATIFKNSPITPLLSNALQILASFLGAAACFGARRRGRGLSRSFWLLVGCGFAIWGISNIFWGYYEVVLHAEPPAGSFVRYLFTTQRAFFAMALLLEENEKSKYGFLESAADFVQLVIVFTLIYLGVYYIPSLHMASQTALDRSIQVELGESCALIALALIQRTRNALPQTRSLFGGFAVYMAVYTTASAIAEYHPNLQNTTTGNPYDLCWTAALLFGAMWAARWEPTKEIAPQASSKTKSFSQLAMNNAAYVLAPLIVMIQIAGMPTDWRLLRFSLLGLSIICYAVRLSVSQFRASQNSELARRHALAMDSAVDGMAILSGVGRFEYVNAAFARMSGHDEPEKILGKEWRDVLAAHNLERLELEIRKELIANGKWFGPVTIQQRRGASVPIEMAITVLPGGGTVCVSRDISDRRNAELARRDAEFRYQTLVEQVAAISYIAELGIDGKWSYVSPQVEGIFGYTPEEWLAESQHWIRHIPAEDHSVVAAAEEASKRGAPFHVEYRVMRKDGRIIWVSDTAVVVRRAGEQAMMEGIIVDITERKQHENQSQQSRRMEAVGRLAGGIAHDFNNLLTIIKGYAELALNRPALPAGIVTDVQQISGAAERAATLVRQLLAFSRRQVLQPKPVDINSIVIGLDKLLRRLIDENIVMRTICSDKLGTVKADPAQIEQVVMNLVVNARDAMPRGGTLTVETSNAELDAEYAVEHMTVRSGKYVMLAVSDTGVGISPEAQSHIFEPFYTTKSGGRGTGLGLSTVYGIVKQSGGYVWVYSELNRGTTFKVYLPLVEDAAAAEAIALHEHVTARGTETILLVEDQDAVRELARTVLESQGYAVVEAISGEQAEQLANGRPGKINLLLTDVVMPGMSGRELAQRLSTGSPEMRVLFMSGYTDNVIAQGGVLEAGMSFLQKPFSPRVLAAKVREVLDNPVVAN